MVAVACYTSESQLRKCHEVTRIGLIYHFDVKTIHEHGN